MLFRDRLRGGFLRRAELCHLFLCLAVGFSVAEAIYYLSGRRAVSYVPRLLTSVFSFEDVFTFWHYFDHSFRIILRFWGILKDVLSGAQWLLAWLRFLRKTNSLLWICSADYSSFNANQAKFSARKFRKCIDMTFDVWYNINEKEISGTTAILSLSCMVCTPRISNKQNPPVCRTGRVFCFTKM